MRIVALACSTVLLSGCSWLGLGGNAGSHHSQYGVNSSQASGRYQDQRFRGQNTGFQQQRGAAMAGPCEIRAVSQAIPTGCRPDQVTVALGGGQQGYGQQGYGQQGYGEMATPSASAYGSSAGQTAKAYSAANSGIHQYWQRPRFRVNGSLGLETSISGQAVGNADMAAVYDHSTHHETTISGTQTDLLIERRDYMPTVAGVIGVEALRPSISFSDLYAAPLTLSTGAEYQLNDSFSVFANAGYTHAQGQKSGGALYEADVTQISTNTAYIEDPLNAGSFLQAGPPTIFSTSRNDIIVAKDTAEFSDLQRFNLEVGGRHYFKDAFTNHLVRPVTPYIGATAGAAHYNALTVSQEAEELLLAAYWADPTSLEYSREAKTGPVEVIQEGWVPTGSLKVGAEWQITPKTALAFETGVNFEGTRDFTSGGTTDYNVSIPLTLRGSIGF